MGAYAVRRALLIPVTVILASMLVFLLVRFIPGDIVDFIQAQMAANGGNWRQFGGRRANAGPEGPAFGLL